MSISKIKEYISYNHKTGNLKWKKQKGTASCGDLVGSINGNGYVVFKFDGIMLSGHRVAWELFHNEIPDQIDHINGNRCDNRIKNLRSVSQQENGLNQRINKLNTSGTSGVYYEKDRNKWVARITVNRVRLNLGRFQSYESAVSARKNAEMTYGYHKNHGDRKL